MRRTHQPATESDTGPAEPRTRCGRVLHAVDLVPYGELPTCLNCRGLRPRHHSTEVDLRRDEPASQDDLDAAAVCPNCRRKSRTSSSQINNVWICECGQEQKRVLA